MDGPINPRYVKIIVFILALLFVGVLFFNNYFVTLSLSYLLVYKYITIFFLFFLAGLCVPIPMYIILMAIGAFAVKGYFNIKSSFLVAASGNSLGDISAYFFFLKYSHSILRDQYARRYKFFVKLETYFRSYTVLSILISRVIGLFGTPVDFLSGYLKIPVYKYVLADIVGNIAFVVIFLGIGEWIGDSWIVTSSYFGDVMTVVSFGITFFLIYILFLRKDKAGS